MPGNFNKDVMYKTTQVPGAHLQTLHGQKQWTVIMLLAKGME